MDKSCAQRIESHLGLGLGPRLCGLWALYSAMRLSSSVLETERIFFNALSNRVNSGLFSSAASRDFLMLAFAPPAPGRSIRCRLGDARLWQRRPSGNAPSQSTLF